ncbi:uncharacterized protein LOC108103858 [Drosophila eugracilis]|uniref:uncharacterized protein LOC108103858 n=1 Tax=Drosophila eugracilis TaxID=29029 RepID=UPI0007E841C5|nr:uncharacterized protein LOC108103858 [Drosophila eugracilis]XP_017065052.1 uncharacterized protein LOC108103858 [Drosophila eugracilis]XP_017065053.1 uncharacterized protein LOC108103858 [Drosophila eugracilis]XP_017065054.1 uncharacterized protein LOC108103858 [Drosophila eugracilis]
MDRNRAAIFKIGFNNFRIISYEMVINRTEPNQDRRSAKMMVVQAGGSQYFVTFTLPRASCTVHELLTQMNIPFDENTIIDCIPNIHGNIHIVVSVGFSLQGSAGEIIPQAEMLNTHMKQLKDNPHSATAALMAEEELQVATTTSDNKKLQDSKPSGKKAHRSNSKKLEKMLNQKKTVLAKDDLWGKLGEDTDYTNKLCKNVIQPPLNVFPVFVVPSSKKATDDNPANNAAGDPNPNNNSQKVSGKSDKEEHPSNSKKHKRSGSPRDRKKTRKNPRTPQKSVAPSEHVRKNYEAKYQGRSTPHDDTEVNQMLRQAQATHDEFKDSDSGQKTKKNPQTPQDSSSSLESSSSSSSYKYKDNSQSDGYKRNQAFLKKIYGKRDIDGGQQNGRVVERIRYIKEERMFESHNQGQGDLHGCRNRSRSASDASLVKRSHYGCFEDGIDKFAKRKSYDSYQTMMGQDARAPEIMVRPEEKPSTSLLFPSVDQAIDGYKFQKPFINEKPTISRLFPGPDLTLDNIKRKKLKESDFLDKKPRIFRDSDQDSSPKESDFQYEKPRISQLYPGQVIDKHKRKKRKELDLLHEKSKMSRLFPEINRSNKYRKLTRSTSDEKPSTSMYCQARSYPDDDKKAGHTYKRIRSCDGSLMKRRSVGSQEDKIVQYTKPKSDDAYQTMLGQDGNATESMIRTNDGFSEEKPATSRLFQSLCQAGNGPRSKKPQENPFSFIKKKTEGTSTPNLPKDAISENPSSSKPMTLEEKAEQSRLRRNRKWILSRDIDEEKVVLLSSDDENADNDGQLENLNHEDGEPSDIYLSVEENLTLLMYPPKGTGALAITMKDYLCLSDESYLNDIIIDFYLAWLKDKLPMHLQYKTHIFGTFFHKRLTSTKYVRGHKKAKERHEKVQKWTRTVNIFEKDFVIVPFNVDAHWMLAIICYPGLIHPIPYKKYETMSSDTIKQPVILIFDSLAGRHETDFDILRGYLTFEYKAKYPHAEPRIFNETNMPGQSVTVPLQKNLTDCGLYLLQYAEHFFRKPIKDFRLPIQDMSNWFDLLTVTKKREEIACLIQFLMDEANPQQRKILPVLQFPTLHGQLLKKRRSGSGDQTKKV